MFTINNVMAKQKNFINLIENYKKRFESGGFLVGDIFKFNDNFKTQDDYKSLGQGVKDHIDRMIDSGLHIRVVDLRDMYPGRYPGSQGGSSSSPMLVIALDTTGGRLQDHCTIPCSLGQPADDPYPQSIPDALIRPNNINIKPVEVNPEEAEESITNMTDAGDGKLRPTSRRLPTKHTALPSSAATPSMEVNSYTKNYLSDLKS